MTLICLRCMAKGTVSLLLDETPRFTCNKCGQTYGSAEARAEIAQIRECWEKVLTWAETMPKAAAASASASATNVPTKPSAPAPTAPTKSSSATKPPSPSKPSLPKPPTPPKPGGSPRAS